MIPFQIAQEYVNKILIWYISKQLSTSAPKFMTYYS